MNWLDTYKSQPPAFVDLTHTEFKELLDLELTPVMRERGLTYDGRYTWYGEMNNSMRKSISAYLLKSGAIFRWAITFDFIPWVSGNRLVYSRTEKNIFAHLYEYPHDFYAASESWEAQERWANSTCRMTQMALDGIQKIIDSIHTAFAHDLKWFDKWHSEFNTIDDALRMVNAKIMPHGELMYYNFYPSPVYIKAFLLAATDNKEEGRCLLQRHFEHEHIYLSWSDDIKNKLLKKLDDV